MFQTRISGHCGSSTRDSTRNDCAETCKLYQFARTGPHPCRPRQPDETRRVPFSAYALVMIACVAVIGIFTLGDQLTFDNLRDNREALLAYRDTHFWLMALGLW